MAEAYIIDAVRTPVGKRGGGLAGVHSADLGAHVIKGLTERTDFDPGAVEDVIFGCCDTIGSQAGDIARTCLARRRSPSSRPGRNDRSTMWFVTTIRAFRRSGSHERDK